MFGCWKKAQGRFQVSCGPRPQRCGHARVSDSTAVLDPQGNRFAARLDGSSIEVPWKFHGHAQRVKVMQLPISKPECNRTGLVPTSNETYEAGWVQLRASYK
jgi:hypothetical protein